MPLIAVVNKKRLLASSHFSQSLWHLPHSHSHSCCCSSCCACSLWLFCQLTVNACQSRSDGQLAIHSAKPESTESIHSLGQAGIHPFTHSGIHSFNHSVSHLAGLLCSQSTPVGVSHALQQVAGNLCNLVAEQANLQSAAGCQSQLHHHHVASALLAVACCEFNDAAHSTVIKSVWHFNLKAATFHMPHAACRMQQQAGSLQRTLNTLLA